MSKALSGINGLLGIAIFILVLISTLVLRSITPELYPNYYIYLVIAIFVFYVFYGIDFEIFKAFSTHLYITSLLLLILPLIIGQVTRGAVRWIPLGSITIQPSEIVRPFLLLFFAKFVIDNEMNPVNLIKAVILFIIPFALILIQPSLGVAVLTGIGFVGVLMASSINKKYFLYFAVVIAAIVPLVWPVLAPYQKQRISSFIDPANDPLGTGYNSIQSMISVGSGRLFGRGLGKGVQTQLAFLPEKHTDFMFAAIAEELGFVGSILIFAGLFTVFWLLIIVVERANGQVERAYATGIFMILFAETAIHIGMNMGVLPITGVPLPFVSAGGSALIGTTIAIAIAMNAKRE
ncbi:MAG: rod shape-determining protein RodA [Thermodesulfovibrionia bacterium]|nr:rod shape-determining protein RodA [Thermodesulfovibrionia bacterium]